MVNEKKYSHLGLVSSVADVCPYCGIILGAKSMGRHIKKHQGHCPACGTIALKNLETHLAEADFIRRKGLLRTEKKNRPWWRAVYECLVCHEEVLFEKLSKHCAGLEHQRAVQAHLKELSQVPPPGKLACPVCTVGRYYTAQEMPEHFQKKHSHLPPALFYLRLKEVIGEKAAEPYKPIIQMVRPPVRTKERSKAYIIDEFGNLKFISGFGKSIFTIRNDKNEMNLSSDTEKEAHASNLPINAPKSEEMSPGKVSQPISANAEPPQQETSESRCKHCGAVLQSAVEEQKHRRKHERLCPVCQKVLQIGTLDLHLKAEHSLALQSHAVKEAGRPIRKAVYRCLKCNGEVEFGRFLTHPREHLFRKKQPPKRTESLHPSGKAPKKKTFSSRRPRSGSQEAIFGKSIFDDGGTDGGKYLGWHRREDGRFGSLPEYDDYSEESGA